MAELKEKTEETEISIHALLTECDLAELKEKTEETEISIHALLTECDTISRQND